MNWFIPAFVKRRVGSSAGTREEEATRRCPFSSKYERNVSRTLREVQSDGVVIRGVAFLSERIANGPGVEAAAHEMVEEFPRPRNGRQTCREAPALLREGGPEAGRLVLSPDAGDGPRRVLLSDAPGAQRRRDAAVPPPAGGLRARQLRRRRRLVEEAGAREQVQRPGDLRRLVARPEELSLQLAPRVGAAAQKRERRRPAVPARAAARFFAQGGTAYGWLEKSKRR